MNAGATRYLSTLELPETWFAGLKERMPELAIHRVLVDDGEEIDDELLRSIQFLHTSSYLPQVDAAPQLRCVQLDTSGVDHLIGSSLWASTIPIATLGGIAPVPMGEYALMGILALAHHLPALDALRLARRWPSNSERLAQYTPRQLEGSTVGIIGYGRVGREIARLCGAFGMNTIGVRRSASTVVENQFDAATRGSNGDGTEILGIDVLDDVLERSDVIVVVVPLTDLSRGMIGAPQLDRMRRGSILVNIARGGIVDEPALLERLRDGRIGGVAIDVFDDEPLPADSPWWSEPNAIVTPHVAGLAPQYHAQTLDLVVENLRRLEDGRPLLNEVNRVAGY